MCLACFITKELHVHILCKLPSIHSTGAEESWLLEVVTNILCITREIINQQFSHLHQNVENVIFAYQVAWGGGPGWGFDIIGSCTRQDKKDMSNL